MPTFLEKLSLSAVSSAIGFSKAMRSRPNVRRGTTALKTVVALSSICLATGDTSLTTFSGQLKAFLCIAATHLPQRWDEEGEPYQCTAEDAAYATFELENGIIAHFNSSWAVRVRRDDLLTIHVDGLNGSAIVGLRDCWIQPLSEHRVLSGIRISNNRSNFLMDGSRSLSRKTMRTHSERSGNSSSDMSLLMNPSRGRCSRVPRVCN